MARPAIVVALPPAEREPVSAELRAAGFDAIDRSRRPDELEALLADPPRRRRRDPRRRERPRHLARVLRRCSTRAAAPHPGAHGRVAASPGAAVRGPVASIDDEFFTRPYSADADPLAGRGDVHPVETVDDGSRPVIQRGSSRWATGRAERP